MGIRRRSFKNAQRPGFSAIPPSRLSAAPRHSIDPGLSLLRQIGDCLADSHHGVGRRRRLFWRQAGQGRRRRPFRGPRLPSRRHARAWAGDREHRPLAVPAPAEGQRHRRSGHHRPGRYGDVRRQALGHRKRGAPAPADHGAGHRHHLVPERRAEGRHAAPGVRRQGADGRRRLCGDGDRPAGRDRADRPAQPAGVRRIRRPPLASAPRPSSPPARPAASMPS